MEVLCERHTLFSALTPLRPLSALGAMRARNSPLEGCPRIYGGRRLFETRRTKKMRLSGQSPSPEKAHYVAGEFENRLRESMGIVCSSQNPAGRRCMSAEENKALARREIE